MADNWFEYRTHRAYVTDIGMSAKVHILGSGAAGRFHVHRAAPRHNREDGEPELRCPQDHLKAALAPDKGNLAGSAVVRSERMKAVSRLAEKIARTNATVLIGGESVSGKEVVARTEHDRACPSPVLSL